MKNLTKKLMLSIMAIAFVVIALGTSTFAWFTLSNKAAVGQFNAEVTAGEGMELSLDGTTWYSSIPEGVIQDYITTAFLGSENANEEPVLSAVTTADAGLLTFHKLSDDQTTFETATANKDYIKIRILVRAVKLTKVSIDELAVTGTPKPWVSDLAFTGADGSTVAAAGSVTVNAANAARIGIIGTSNHVFENIGSGTNKVLGDGLPSLPANGQADYFLKKTGESIFTKTNAPTAVIDSATVAAGVEILTLVDASNGYNEASFDLLVWFEGFDPDTYDSILKMNLNIVISFEGALL